MVLLGLRTVIVVWNFKSKRARDTLCGAGCLHCNVDVFIDCVAVLIGDFFIYFVSRDLWLLLLHLYIAWFILTWNRKIVFLCSFVRYSICTSWTYSCHLSSFMGFRGHKTFELLYFILAVDVFAVRRAYFYRPEIEDSILAWSNTAGLCVCRLHWLLLDERCCIDFFVKLLDFFGYLFIVNSDA